MSDKFVMSFLWEEYQEISKYSFKSERTVENLLSDGIVSGRRYQNSDSSYLSNLALLNVL